MILILVLLFLTIYAAVDCVRTPEEKIPAKLPKPMWVVIIILSGSFFAIGSLVWIALRYVARAEARAAKNSSTSSGSRLPRWRRENSPAVEPTAPAPDDDPDFLFKIERDIQRHRKNSENTERNSGKPKGKSSPDSDDKTDETNDGAPNDPTDGSDS